MAGDGVEVQQVVVVVVGLEVRELLEASTIEQRLGVVEGQRDPTVLDVAQLRQCEPDSIGERCLVDTQHAVAPIADIDGGMAAEVGAIQSET